MTTKHSRTLRDAYLCIGVNKVKDGVLGKSKYTLGRAHFREHFRLGQPHSGVVLQHAKQYQEYDLYGRHRRDFNNLKMKLQDGILEVEKRDHSLRGASGRSSYYELMTCPLPTKI